jgi:hypothetical protein
MVELPINDDLQPAPQGFHEVPQEILRIFSNLIQSLKSPARTKVFNLGYYNLVRTCIRYIYVACQKNLFCPRTIKCLQNQYKDMPHKHYKCHGAAPSMKEVIKTFIRVSLQSLVGATCTS